MKTESDQAYLKTHIDGQDTPFTITGNVEIIEELYKAAEARDRHQTAQHATKRGKAIVEAVRGSGDGFLGRLAVNVRTVAYDAVHNTAMYDLLKQKRADERDVAFATSIGLLTVGETMCQKHRHAVDKLRGE